MRCIVFVSISVSHHGHFRGGRGALRVSRSGPPHSMRWQLAFSPAQLSNIVAPDFLLSLQIPVYHSLLNIGNSKYHRKQSCQKLKRWGWLLYSNQGPHSCCVVLCWSWF
ncbi:hypothetical protein FOXG_18783 [Fusarium oxysporum f. sp. lycopersici 4287]|uniref:Uncharacterized protein n=2 Tax=Fusarium oxysporum TaxID=5507 RepID=A0A0J9WJU5_FUSO4|nr:hypothetical protein FOXG_18783 [Fusarium oxysporum f. sp. lycopersici 4287]EXK44032.1 hypothetical protein FOMG_02889 [Fusarium oxysporum f. sp. melonis 26406]KNB00892.1 hypothetical protein FOXG_18783 [Fusarium oxysporum f. sp. lycopersici 4287]